MRPAEPFTRRALSKLAAFATLYKPDPDLGAINMAHIALIGDSVFDNGAYIVTPPDPAENRERA